MTGICNPDKVKESMILSFCQFGMRFALISTNSLEDVAELNILLISCLLYYFYHFYTFKTLKINTMKTLISVISFCLIFSAIILSCSKNIENGSSQTNSCKLTGWVQGVNSSTDTAYFISYDNNNRISTISSTYGGRFSESDSITYDINGRLSNIMRYQTIIQLYTYNNSGLLSTVNSSMGNETIIHYGSNNLPSIVLTYSGGNLACTDSLHFNANGDLTAITEITNSDTIKATLQYTSFKNSLATIELFNVNGLMGLNDMYVGVYNGFEVFAKYFSAHLIKGATFSNGYSISFTYNFDTSQNVTFSKASLVKSGLPAGVFTRNYTYNCN